MTTTTQLPTLTLGVKKPKLSVTSIVSLSLIKRKVPDAYKATQVVVLALVSASPDFSWIDMFIDEVFPFDISYNSIGTTTFLTDITVVDNGYAQRSSRWEYPLMQYDVAYGVRTMEQLHGLITFFRAMKGRKHGFLYRDPMDCTSTLAVATEARKAPSISALDQLIGTGDGQTFKFQLSKSYTAVGGTSSDRPIYKPKEGTVLVALNGVVTTQFSVDTSTGIVTLKEPASFTGLTATMTIDDTNGTRVTANPGSFSALKPGSRIYMTGWTNAINNNPDSVVLSAAVVASDGSWFLIAGPSGYGLAEGPTSGVSVYVHPAPNAGVQVTAGFEFYVPVRFDTDTLPTTLEYYGVGSASNVKLIELRNGNG